MVYTPPKGRLVHIGGRDELRAGTQELTAIPRLFVVGLCEGQAPTGYHYLCSFTVMRVIATGSGYSLHRSYGAAASVGSADVDSDAVSSVAWAAGGSVATASSVAEPPQAASTAKANITPIVKTMRNLKLGNIDGVPPLPDHQIPAAAGEFQECYMTIPE